MKNTLRHFRFPLSEILTESTACRLNRRSSESSTERSRARRENRTECATDFLRSQQFPLAYFPWSLAFSAGTTIDGSSRGLWSEQQGRSLRSNCSVRRNRFSKGSSRQLDGRVKKREWARREGKTTARSLRRIRRYIFLLLPRAPRHVSPTESDKNRRTINDNSKTPVNNIVKLGKEARARLYYIPCRG